MKISWNLSNLFDFRVISGHRPEINENKISNVGATAINRSHFRCDTSSQSCRFPLFRAVLLIGLVAHGRGQLANPFPAQFELSSLDGTNGFILKGEATGDECGFSVSSAGDLNRDGIADLAVGSISATALGKSKSGKSYVIFGSRGINNLLDGNASIDLSNLNGTQGFFVNGQFSGDKSGYSISGATDVNGDGIDDLLIGARYAEYKNIMSVGKSYVIFGKPGIGSDGSIQLSSLDGNNGFILIGEKAGDFSGRSVSFAGDVNGDGIADMIIGANKADPLGLMDAGTSYVVFGSRSFNASVSSNGSFQLSSLNGRNGIFINGVQVEENSGISVSGVGDVNGDGLADILIGAYHADTPGKSNVGKGYLVLGRRYNDQLERNGGMIELSNLNGFDVITFNGVAAYDKTGYSVSRAGDVNGDGLLDFVIGALFADPLSRPNAGKSYVVFGSRNYSSLMGNESTIELSSLDGSNGFVLYGEQMNDNSGFSVSAAGDVNGDGLDDILVGAPHAASSNKSKSGKSYVIFGNRNFSKLVEKGGYLELSWLDGSNGFTLSGEFVGDSSGYSVTGAGDVNGDGIDDILIGAIRASSLQNSVSGKAYVVYGRKLSHPGTISSTDLILNSSVTATLTPTFTSRMQTRKSLEQITTISTLKSEEQSIVLPLVLALSATFCLSGIAVYVIVFRKCNKKTDEKGDSGMSMSDPRVQPDWSDQNYQLITIDRNYQFGNLSSDC